MVGGLKPPPASAEEAEAVAAKSNVIFILEDADLQVGKVGTTYQLLNSDDHANFIKRKGEDPSVFRPDICHQALLSILDSPLNKAGKIKKVYVRSKKNVLIEIHPQVRLPRTFRRFCGLLCQLLQKLSIRATNGKEKLLKVVKGPVTRYLPSDAIRVGFSHQAPEVKDIFSFVRDECEEGKTLVFVLGAFAHGKVDVAYQDTQISISQYPLSAAQAITRITNALEQKWSIL